MMRIDYLAARKASRVAMAIFLAASAKLVSLLAYKIALDELMIMPVPGALLTVPAFTVDGMSPPWAPIPGINKGISPTILLTLAISSGKVAPD